MLVVGIMAILGGILIASYGGGQSSIRSQTQIKAAHTEMEAIRQSLLQYKRDNIAFPLSPTTAAHESPADFNFLFSPPDSTSSWNIEYQIGWRGPYITGGDSGQVDIGDDLGFNGSGDPTNQTLDAVTGITNAKRLQRGIPDPFTYTAVNNNTFTVCSSESTSNNQCLLDWRFVGEDNSMLPHEKFGRPYLLFDLGDTDKARIVSMGRNGRYDGEPIANCATNFISSGSNDDLILCLY